jgi:2-deoxy-D-gluconate 3-dehydrogenase
LRKVDQRQSSSELKMAISATMAMFSLEGQKAVITGGTRGIGQAVAVSLAECGADIILIQVYFLSHISIKIEIDLYASTNQPQRDHSNTTTLKAIEALGRKATIYTADLSSQAEVAALTPAILKDGHKINILVNCAGIQRRHPSAEFPDNDWNEVSHSPNSVERAGGREGADGWNERSSR